MKLACDHVCVSVNKIHERIAIYKDVDTQKRYLELVDHKTKEFRYYPIHYYNGDNFSVDFSKYLTRSDFQRVYRLGTEMYDLETMERLN